MNTLDCIKTRRSIRTFKDKPIPHTLLESIIETASYSPSWKHTQITRYIAIESPSLISEIANHFTPDYNSKIIHQLSTLIAVTYITKRSGFERDGSFSTKKEDRWQMFDAGVASQSVCLAAHEVGLGTVIMGIFDEEKITKLLDLPDGQELAALIAIGYPDESPNAPKRKTVQDLLSYQ